MSLRFTLRADGPTDCMLMPIIRWALLKQLPAEEIHGQFANPKSLPRGSSSKLDRSIRAAVDFFPCDVLFIHRDAENELPAKRLEEIKKATEYPDVFSSPFVPVIPVRMSEAWLLIDERAIRRAAGNPNGKIHIALPSIKNLEKLPDPKQELRAILKSASGLGGRRLKAFRTDDCIPLISELIADFSALGKLTAFQQFMADVRLFCNRFQSSDHEQT